MSSYKSPQTHLHGLDYRELKDLSYRPDWSLYKKNVMSKHRAFNVDNLSGYIPMFFYHCSRKQENHRFMQCTFFFIIHCIYNFHNNINMHNNILSHWSIIYLQRQFFTPPYFYKPEGQTIFLVCRMAFWSFFNLKEGPLGLFS